MSREESGQASLRAAGSPEAIEPVDRREHTIGVAIPIAEPHGRELQSWREQFGDPLALLIPTHITLLPPTVVPDEALPGIEEHLRTVAESAQPFAIRLRGTGTFRPVSPVVFVTLAEGIAGCEVLEAGVRSGPLSHRDLEFAYHPHVTVAHDVAEELLDHAFEKLTGYDARFEVWGFALYAHGQDGFWRPQRDFAFGGVVPQHNDAPA